MCVSRQAGFTMVELLVVILVLGLLAAIIVPTAAEVHGQASVSSAAGELAVLMRWAQARAQVRAEHVRVTVAADSSYAVSDQSGGEGCVCRQGKIGNLRLQQQLPRLCSRVPARRMAGGGGVVGAAGGHVRLLLRKRDVACRRAAHGVRAMPLKGGRGFSLLEAIIAVVLLGCTVTAVTGLVSLAQGQTVSCAHGQQARQLVANTIEDLRSLPFLRSGPEEVASQGEPTW